MVQPKEEIDRRPLTNAERVLLDEKWSQLWPSDAQSIQSAVQVLKREGRDVVQRAAYEMAMRTQPMPSAYWPIIKECTSEVVFGYTTDIDAIVPFDHPYVGSPIFQKGEAKR